MTEPESVTSAPWFFLDVIPPSGKRAILEGAEAKHAAGARRLKPGEAAVVFDGSGRVGMGRIDRAGRQAIELTIKTIETQPPPSPYVHLVCALPKGDRQSVLISMATQLSVAAISPLSVRHSIVRPGRGFADRAQRITVEACKQSRRAHLPEVTGEMSLDEVLHAAAASNMTPLVADPTGAPLARMARDVANHAPSGRRWMVIIGPEGGLSEDEVNTARQGGAVVVSLGRRILRIETACAAAAAWLMLTAESADR